MDNEPLLNQAHRFARQAEDATSRGHWQQAIDKHYRAAHNFLICVGQSSNLEANRTLILLVDRHYRAAANIRAFLSADSVRCVGTNELSVTGVTRPKGGVSGELLLMNPILHSNIRAAFNDLTNLLELLQSPHQKEIEENRARAKTLVHDRLSGHIARAFQSESFFLVQETEPQSGLLSHSHVFNSPSREETDAAIGPMIKEDFYNPLRQSSDVEDSNSRLRSENQILKESLVSLLDGIEKDQQSVRSFRLNFKQKAIALRTLVEKAKPASPRLSACPSPRSPRDDERTDSLREEIVKLRNANAKYAAELPKLRQRIDKYQSFLKQERAEKQDLSIKVEKYDKRWAILEANSRRKKEARKSRSG